MIAHDLEDAADQADGDLSLPPKPKLTKRQVNRLKALLPGGTPRYVRCYDNGGETCDRYTVVYSGKAGAVHYPGRGMEYSYRGMSTYPFHPQGFGMWGSTKDKPCDVDRWGFPPALGRKCHLGKRIPFAELPPDCRKLVLQDYREIWNLKGGAL